MRRISLVLLCAVMLFASSCASTAPAATAPAVTTAGPASTSAPFSTVAVIAPVTTQTSVSQTAAATNPPATSVATPEVLQPTGYWHPLTGLPCSEDLVNRRPIAVMINNIKASMPQIGIAQADIIYECLAEGGITRLLAIYQDYSNLGTVGSIRSSRDYYLDLAQIHDAFYIHAGGSEIAYSQIASRDIDNLDGVRTTVSGVFWRDSDRLQTMSKEHTMVTSGEKIAMGIQKQKYRTEHESSFESSYSFYRSFTALNGSKAEYIKIPHSSSYTSEFYYDEDLKLYRKNQFGKAHIDGATGEQLSFTNVIILFAEQKTVDDYGRLEVTLTGTGSGYYCCGGEMIPITWKRSDRDGGITLLNQDGSPLQLNPGKSFISIASTKIQKKTIVE